MSTLQVPWYHGSTQSAIPHKPYAGVQHTAEHCPLRPTQIATRTRSSAACVAALLRSTVCVPREYPFEVPYQHPRSTLGVPIRTLHARAHRCAPPPPVSCPESGYRKSTPRVSPPYLRVPFEYPVSTRYVLPYSECAQHCRALPTHYPTNTAASTRSTFAAAASTLLSTLV